MDTPAPLVSVHMNAILKQRIRDLEAELAAMTASRDYAVNQVMGLLTAVTKLRNYLRKL